MCEGIDPYQVETKDWQDDFEALPLVCPIALYSYLVSTTDFLTKEQFNAFKSTEAHTFFTDGWIEFVWTKQISSGKVIVGAKVRHSQCTSEPPLKCWILAKRDGEVMTTHCKCMAGLSSCCSHVGAVLFALSHARNLKEAKSCTSKPCSWLPAYVADVPVGDVRNFDFSSAVTKHKKLTDVSPKEPRPSITKQKDFRVSKDRLLETLSAIHRDCDPGVIFRVMPEFCDQFVPKPPPVSLLNIFQKSATNLPLDELISKCRDIFQSFTVSEEEAGEIEEKTRGQNNNKEWYYQRTGRITASKVKAVCSTQDLKHPSMSLVKSICYPMKNGGKTKSMERGIKLEPAAHASFVFQMKKDYKNLQAKQCGLFVSTKYPYLGASPDAVLMCDCHGPSIAEYKCPDSENDYVVHGQLPLNHPYFYQVQLQLLVLNFNTCYFVVYRPGKCPQITVVKENCTVQQEILSKSEIFFTNVILPELVGRYFSSNQQVFQALPPNLQNVICICKQPPTVDKVIICAKPTCAVKAYHFKCVKVKRFSRKWRCENCVPRKV